MNRVIANTALLFDEFSDASARPRLIAVPKRSRAALEPGLDLADLTSGQERLAPGAARLPQATPPLRIESGGPTPDRLPVNVEGARRGIPRGCVNEMIAV